MCAAAVLAAVAAPGPRPGCRRASTAARQITLVIGYGPGGGYDLYARMLGRFIGAHIPGNPTIVPQNMPGAGSRSAANWLYKVAPQDGTVIACLGQATPTDQALSQPGVQFDAAQIQLDRQSEHRQQHSVRIGGERRFHVRAGQDQTTRHRRHRRQFALGALSAGLQQSARQQVQDHRRLSGRRRHQYRGRAARGGRPRQRFLGVDESHAPGLAARPHDQYSVPGRPAARSRSARRAAVDRTCRERRPAPGARAAFGRRVGRAADPDGAQRSRRSRQGAASGLR